MKSDRQRRILELLRENERLDVNELSRLLGVSLPTVRRDLLDLSEQALIQRRYGSGLSTRARSTIRRRKKPSDAPPPTWSRMGKWSI
jgi:DeoR/GlpR family transcriptional regulator of sugar metabolism